MTVAEEQSINLCNYNKEGYELSIHDDVKVNSPMNNSFMTTPPSSPKDHHNKSNNHDDTSNSSGIWNEQNDGKDVCSLYCLHIDFWILGVFINSACKKSCRNSSNSPQKKRINTEKCRHLIYLNYI